MFISFERFGIPEVTYRLRSIRIKVALEVTTLYDQVSHEMVKRPSHPRVSGHPNLARCMRSEQCEHRWPIEWIAERYGPDISAPNLQLPTLKRRATNKHGPTLVLLARRFI